MIVMMIVIGVCLIGELCLFAMWQMNKRKKKNKVIKSLYKLMEERVLSATLRNRITSEQAAAMEYQNLFLQLEFKYAKPSLMYVFDLEESITIGRSRENKICIRDDTLSRMHCKIALINGNLYIQDLGTANGTVIKRGVRKIYIPSQQSEIVEDGDLLMVGNYKIKIQFLYGYEAAI